MNELQVTFNPHRISDNAELSRVIKLNMPTFFDPDEIEDYLRFLNSQKQFYFTVHDENKKVVGGFGYSLFSSEGFAKIDWIFFDPKIHGQGIGSKAVRFCESHILPHKAVKKIVITTSQKTSAFFEKLDYRLEKTQADFWGKGLHLHQVVKSIG